MAKLADIDSEIRIILKVAAGFFSVLILLFLVFKGGAMFKDLFFPTPPPPPDLKFGKLPEVSFPAQNPVSGVEYRINTLTGELPVLTDRIKVYKIKRDKPSLTALANSRNSVSQQGFTQNETKISESVYQWNNDSGQQIQYNIMTNNFVISSNFLTQEPPTSLTGVTGTTRGAYDYTLNYLNQLNEDTSDFDENRSTGTYLRIEGGQLVPVDSQGQAQFMKLSLFQKDINKIKVYYPGVTTSNMSFIYRDDSAYPTLEQAEFTHLVPDLNNSGTYPIKTAEQAFEDLKKGNALINKTTSNSTVDITDVALGYYLGDSEQEYTVPIIVFTGKDFTAYVQAVAN